LEFNDAYLFEVSLTKDLLEGLDADIDNTLSSDFVEDTVLFVLMLLVDFLEPSILPQTLFSRAENVNFIAVFATSHPGLLHFAFFTQDKISLLHCFPLLLGVPQHWSCCLQHESRESFEATPHRQFGPSAPLNFSPPQ